MKFQYNDGGRSAAGIKGHGGDCVARSIAIITEIPYKEVVAAINEIAQKHERRGKSKKAISNGRTEVYRYTYDRYLKSLGYTWVPTMFIGSGCKVHLREDELPKGRLLVCLSLHMVAVIDGVMHDTDDHSRGEKRCVYGYYHKPQVCNYVQKALTESFQFHRWLSPA